MASGGGMPPAPRPGHSRSTSPLSRRLPRARTWMGAMSIQSGGEHHSLVKINGY